MIATSSRVALSSSLPSIRRTPLSFLSIPSSPASYFPSRIHLPSHGSNVFSMECTLLQRQPARVMSNQGVCQAKLSKSAVGGIALSGRESRKTLLLCVRSNKGMDHQRTGIVNRGTKGRSLTTSTTKTNNNSNSNNIGGQTVSESSSSSSSPSSSSVDKSSMTFVQRWMAPKEMPKRGTLRWYGEVALICTVFAITGSGTMFLVRPAVSNVLGLQGSFRDGPWSYRICSLVIMTPLYSVLLVVVGTVFGRHAYFRHFSVKMLSRFGIPPELMDKTFHETAKSFRKW